MIRDRLFVLVLTVALALNLSVGLREGWPGFFGWFIWPRY